MSKNYKILDCTLRDGGYYTDWVFNDELVSDYLDAMVKVGVDVIEIGFRFPKGDGFRGPYAFSRDSFLDGLQLPGDISVSVMLNASDLGGLNGMDERIGLFFPADSKHTRVDMVRIAFHIEELETAVRAGAYLKQLGFKVGLNLMQISDRSLEEISRFASLCSKEVCDVVYVADSTGSLLPKDVAPIVSEIKKIWDGDIGIHTHDNQGYALSNTITALECGVNWIDSTVLGMGRGPGNVKTEEVLLAVEGAMSGGRSIAPLLDTIGRWFQPLKDSYKWGSNPYYFLAGKLKVHPTYVQEMLASERFSPSDIVSAIELLASKGAKKFKREDLPISAVLPGDPLDLGDWRPNIIQTNGVLLLLGGGQSVSVHREALEDFVERKRAVVVATNAVVPVSESLIHYRLACNPARILTDMARHRTMSTPLICPSKRFAAELSEISATRALLNYDLRIEEKTFFVGETGCVLPKVDVLAYFCAVAIASGVEEVLLAGFDGYRDQALHSNVEGVLQLVKSVHPNLSLISITPTTYKNLKASTVYAL